MTKKRRQYRVKPSITDRVDVAVPTSGNDFARGKIEDLSAGGVRVLFKPEVAPAYQLRDVVNLQIRAYDASKPFVVPSVVVHRSDEPAGLVYGFEFIDWLGLVSGVPRELKSLFNRRGDLRVPSHPERPVEATITVSEHAYQTRLPLQEISSRGFSFVIGIEVEEVLRDVDTFDVWIHLPGSSHEIHFAGKILNRDLVHDGIRYGVFFLEEETPSFRRKEEIVAAYVAARRREILGLPAAMDEPDVVFEGEGS